MITGLPLQNKLRTYNNRRQKKRQSFAFQSVGLGPPPTAKPEENFLDPRMDIRYRGGRETTSLLKHSLVLPRSNDHIYNCLFVNIEIKTVGWHIQLAAKHTFIFTLCAGSNPISAFISFSSFSLYHIFTCVL